MLPRCFSSFLLHQKGVIVIDKPDNAYPVLLGMIPQGIRGLAFAALVAAILSSLASMMNSISTIFTMDIYKEYFNQKASEKKLVQVGRLTAIIAMLIAVIIAPMLTRLDQAFQYIQEFTGFISPGALAIFLTGFFYKKATANGALASAIGTFAFSLLFKFILPNMPFMNRMGIVFLLCLLIIWIFAVIENKPASDKVIVLKKEMFQTTRNFKIGAIIIVVILILLYTIWW
jgi:SSS family solute:Na+ symporter